MFLSFLNLHLNQFGIIFEDYNNKIELFYCYSRIQKDIDQKKQMIAKLFEKD